MVSPYCGKEPQDAVERYDRKNKKCINVDRPQAIKQYNRFMGGVDTADKMITLVEK